MRITPNRQVGRLRALIFFNSIFLIFPYSLSVLTAFAQEPPVSEDVGTQAERFLRDAEEKKRLLGEKEKKAPQIEIGIKEEEKEKPPIPAISFVLKGIKITGATVFSPEELYPIYQPYLNQRVTFDDLGVIVEKIKAKYKEKGYLTTTVYIPEQELKEGIIEIVVFEGKMGKLLIEGNKYFSRTFIEKNVHIKKNEALNMQTLQKDILRLNQNIDLEVKAVLAAGEEPLTSDIILKVKERFPWHIGFSEDNLGGRLTGKLRTAYALHSSNFSGCGDSFFMNILFTSRSKGQFLNYVVPLDTYGSRYGLNLVHLTMDVGKEYKALDISGETYIFSPYFTKELYLSEKLNINADIGFEIKSIHKKISGVLTTNDQLRTPYFSLDIESSDPGGRNFFSPRFNFGTEHFLGSSSHDHPSASRADTGGFFFKYEHTLRRIQRMPWGSYLSLRSQFQVPTHILPSSEQFQLGGMDSIRGYPEGDYLCDFGGNLDVDWVFPLYFIPESWKLTKHQLPLRQQIQPVVFADVGGGRIKEPAPHENGEKFLAGVGGGLRIRFLDKAYLRLEWAKHIGDEPIHGVGPSTFYFSFQTEL